MKAIILSAGMGTRVGNHTAVTPKCMLDILGTNILEIQVKQLKMMGINDIFVIGGHYAHKINNPYIKIIENKSYKTTNMFFSLMCARDILDDDVVISYGDIIYFSKILEALIADTRKDIVVADTNWKEYWAERYGKIDYDLESFKITDDYISDIGNSEININQIDARYLGLMKFSKETLSQMIDFYNDNFEKNSFSKIKMMYLTDIIQYLITQKELLIPVKKICRGWCEIDTLNDYTYAKKFFKENQHQIINNEII
tara:strand:- start:3293 stop:4060 length:768 start_codon:yes stop_codon:yes gene_type:complete